MKKTNVRVNLITQNLNKNLSSENDNIEEEFFHEPALEIGNLDILCGNITPQIT